MLFIQSPNVNDQILLCSVEVSLEADNWQIPPSNSYLIVAYCTFFDINYLILTVSLQSILIYFVSTKHPEYQVNPFHYVLLLLGRWVFL